MSFRTRLTVFFVLIVLVPMAALGVVVARLVEDSEQGKAQARASAHLAGAITLYERGAARGLRAAGVVGGDRTLAAALRRGDVTTARTRARVLMRQLGLERVVVRAPADGAPADGAPSDGVPADGAPADRTPADGAPADGAPADPGGSREAGGGTGGAAVNGGEAKPLLDLGASTAIAAGSARVRDAATRVEASTITAAQYAEAVQDDGVEAVVRRGGTVLASSLAGITTLLPTGGETTVDGVDYLVGSFSAADFGGSSDTISLLTDTSSNADAVANDRRLAFALLAAFLVAAFAGALLVSRQLQAQIGRFLTAARKIGAGDLRSRVPTEGRDEFAALGHEFNKMSSELEQRIDDLDRERGRLRDSIQRVGETFASNLDPHALLALGAETALAAVEADAGRARVATLPPVHLGDAADPRLAGLLDQAEARAKATCAPIEVTTDDASAFASPIPRAREGAPPHGLVAVARRGRPFTDEERTVLGSLVAQTGISLENVELHDQVARQAVTDELTGLFNHRRFQEVMDAEIAAARRYDRPLGLLMIDIDNFKSVNDTYGHQQGDLVLKAVAAVLQDSSREIDEPARYGGEEMAVALPQTDLEGAYTIAERVRAAVEALRVPRLDGAGVLRVTVSCGVAASRAASKDQLVASADAALYRAKHSGKNRTVRGEEPAVVPTAAE
jgi:diguanylate cyclase (GGDEF)-like protein